MALWLFSVLRWSNFINFVCQNSQIHLIASVYKQSTMSKFMILPFVIEDDSIIDATSKLYLFNLIPGIEFFAEIET